MRGRVFIDYETKSYCDLKKTGAWVYSQHPSTEIICLCYKIRHADGSSNPVRSWVPGPRLPEDLFTAIRLGYEVEAHNYAFELGIWENICVARLGWPPVPPENWRDTMAVASYYALPAALDALCRALRLPGKNPDGTRLISRYSKLHLKTARQEIPPEDLQKFIDYCKQDVLIEERVSDYLGDLPERELPIFQLDQTINTRGMALDLKGIQAATAVVDKRSEELLTAFRKLTGLNPTQGEKLKTWFAERGLELENMQAEYLEGLLDEDGHVPQGVLRDVLRIRLEINKASTKKLDAMERQRDNKGRARWQTRYHGAQTGRWTGSGFQPLNLNRGFEDVPPEQLVRDIMHEDPRWLDAIYGDAMQAVAKASRHWIAAAPGHSIYAGDFVSIEAVVLACGAGEDWKIEAFRQKKKIYELMGDKIHGYAPGTVTKKTHPAERQDGKTGELAFGYQGALNAWLKFDSSGRHTDERIIEICKAWRAEHPMIVKFWRGLEAAAIEAVKNPGLRTSYRSAGFEVIDEWLAMILPNGKHLWYREPELRLGMPRWHEPEVNADCAAGTCRCRPQAKLTYMAQKAGQWKRVYTYGGKLCLGAGTKVLTLAGWKSIVEISQGDMLWDGEEWVSCGGCVSQGEKKTIDLAGVRMTHDHLVLTKEGWTHASQSEGHYRATSRLPHGRGVCWEQWGEVPMAVPVCVRAGDGTGSLRPTEVGQTRCENLVRMPQERKHRIGHSDPRHDSAPRLWGMEGNDRQMPPIDTPGVAQLRRPGYLCVPAVEEFRGVLEGHGAELPARPVDRTGQQQRELQAKQLHLGDALSPGPQSPYDERVYDVQDCGPRNRFVVRDEHGLPLIVHNCENWTQGTAREYLIPSLFALEAAKYPVILSVYDEAVCEVPDGHGNMEEFLRILRDAPGREWAAGWPIDVDAWAGKVYKK